MADIKRQGPQRMNNPMSKKYQSKAQRSVDHEVGALGQSQQQQQQNHQHQFTDLNTDYEIGNFITDLDAGLDTEFEIGELGASPHDDRSNSRGQKLQRTQRNKTDR